jgi:hypothetical protein
VTHSEAIEVPVPAWKPIPDKLTAPILPPPAPPARCVLDGQPAICVLDALATIPLYQADIDQCNADRATTALLGATDGQ